jgi:guanosine-3',5'-bis(diphosphate) 3'-pyrophosphohydrolase
MRLSGEPYITHPLAVAGAIAEWQMDVEGVVAALLHDVMEDTSVGKSEIAERFGRPVADLVDGLSKLDKIEFQSHEEAQAENFRKMLMAMARDLRVVLIKLADRHHNLQTMAAVRADKRRRIARETLEIYAPIANRLGLNKLFRELQDLSFQLIYPMRARFLARSQGGARQPARAVVADSRRHQGQAARGRRRGAGVWSREEPVFDLSQDARQAALLFAGARRLRFSRRGEGCAHRLPRPGALHGLYKPVPGKFKDYIAIPKPNGYQSLHTTLIGPHGTPFELQIRTEAMDNVAQEGIASHWLYKDSEDLRSRPAAENHQVVSLAARSAECDR